MTNPRVFGLDHLSLVGRDEGRRLHIIELYQRLKTAIHNLGASRELSMAVSNLDQSSLLIAEHLQRPDTEARPMQQATGPIRNR